MTSSVRITDFECTREAHAEKTIKCSYESEIVEPESLIIDETNEVITGLTIKLELLLWN